jgi:hypothetical protein
MPAEGGVVEDLCQAAVLGLHLQRLLQGHRQAMAGVRILEGVLGQGRDLVETLVEERVDHLLLVREPVGGPDADADGRRGGRCR